MEITVFAPSEQMEIQYRPVEAFRDDNTLYFDTDQHGIRAINWRFVVDIEFDSFDVWDRSRMVEMLGDGQHPPQGETVEVYR